jgi:hypothetical protein
MLDAINTDLIERWSPSVKGWWSGAKDRVAAMLARKARDNVSAEPRSSRVAAAPPESWAPSDRRLWLMDEPRWFVAVLAFGVLALMEALSWAASTWPLCQLASEYWPPDQSGRETCAPLSEGVARSAAFLWTHTNPSAVTAIAVIFIAGFTWMMWRSSEQMWHASHAAADAAQRSANALVAAEQAQLVMVFGASNIAHALTELGARAQGGSDEAPPAERVFAQYVLKNYGRTLATLKEISHELVHWNRLPDALRYYPIPALPKERTIVAGASTESLQCTMPVPLTSEAAASIRRGDSFLWLYGHAVYEDVFGQEREHRFLYRYRIGPGFQPYYHQDYNRSS